MESTPPLPDRQTEPDSILDPRSSIVDSELLPPLPDGVPGRDAAPATAPLLSSQDAQQLQNLLARLAGRKAEALKLYEPLPIVDGFHKSAAPERLIRGSNRAGKTLGTCVEVARAVTGRDPYGKYPAAGRCWLVGRDGRHMGEVIYRKLFRAGSFKIVKDPQTGLWRAFRPGSDSARDAKPAPPLIPPRFIKSVAWENKKAMIPSVVHLTTGWEMNFFSSNAVPGQGSDIDLCLFDEEIENESWYAEVAARLLDRKGKFFWSATPQASTQQLYDLSQRAQACRNEPSPAVTEHIALLDDNPHIADAEKLKLAAKLTDEERRVRIGGEFALTGYTVYPEFAWSIHGCQAFPIPSSWCRYIAVDPGRQVCAILFLAVPPPGDRYGGQVFLYREKYIKHCDAAKFADAMKEECEGTTPPQELIIDHHAGRVTEMGSGRTIEEQYSAELKKRSVSAFATGTGFTWGSDDVKAGIQAFRAWLRIRPNGTPCLQAFRECLPNFKAELERYRYRSVRTAYGKVPSDEPEQRDNHLMDTARYLAAHGVPYKAPKTVKQKSYVFKYLDAKQLRKKEREKRWRAPGQHAR